MKKSNKTVVVCFPFVGDFVGGSHVSAIGLIRNLDRSRFLPLVVLHYPDGPVAELFRREGVAYEIAPALIRLNRAGPRNGITILNVARTVPALVRFLRGRNVQIVHTNDGRVHVVWGTAARLAGAKHLWHHRGDAASFGLRYIAPWLPNRLVAVSKFSSPRSGLISAASKSLVVHSPFDVEKLAGFERDRAREMILDATGCPPETKILGYVGSLVERKRPIVFVRALAALKRIAPDLKIAGLFIGNALDDMDNAVRACAEALGIEENIHFMGFRYPGEAWIAGLDALLVTSVDEPLGRTLVEAMLLGTPVIAANSGGSPEAITNNATGMLVRAEDDEGFAQACLRLFRDPAYQNSMVELARFEARKRFSVERHVSAIEEIYENLG